MMGRDYVEKLVARTTADADIAVIEGVMGLFDGAEPDSLGGSTAEIAAWLRAPVILVADVYGMARSLAAVVNGFATFDRTGEGGRCHRQPLRLRTPRDHAGRGAPGITSAAHGGRHAPGGAAGASRAGTWAW